MTRWHILTSEYPPNVGGVSDYTRQVAEALARAGEDVHVWCPPAEQPRGASRVHVHTELGRFRPSDLRRLAHALDPFPSPRRLLVQWVPHGYGYGSMNLWFCFWLAGRAAKGDSVELMVHEPFLELKRGPLRHVAMALVHRVMTMVLLGAASRVWIAIPAWESRLRPYALGRSLRMDWLPIPACLTEPTSGRSVRGMFAESTQLLIGHFGSYGDDVLRLLAESLPPIMNSGARPSLLLIGARSEAFRAALIERHPEWDSRVQATGYVRPTELSQYLEACDLFLQPYPDGITSRRTSAMACLALGRPIVTTSGHLTESLWKESEAVVLAHVSDPSSVSSGVVRLLEDADRRRRVGTRGQDLYFEKFDLSHTLRALAAH